jgi:hypothetical protein
VLLEEAGMLMLGLGGNRPLVRCAMAVWCNSSCSLAGVRVLVMHDKTLYNALVVTATLPGISIPCTVCCLMHVQVLLRADV